MAAVFERTCLTISPLRTGWLVEVTLCSDFCGDWGECFCLFENCLANNNFVDKIFAGWEGRVGWYGLI